MQTKDCWDNITPKLHQDVVKAVRENLKFDSMMPVQKVSIPLILKTHDVAVEAQTGSGKTLAFLLPILHAYASLDKKKKLKKYDVFSIIIVPTRELAKQIYDVLESLKQNIFTELTSQLFIGGTNTNTDAENYLKNGANIIVGTTGKLKEITDFPSVKGIMKLQSLEILILDEADRLMDSEFYEDVQTILGRLPKQRRTSLFSATLTSQKLSELIKFGLRNPVKVSLKQQSKNQDDEAEKQNYMVPATLFNEYLVFNNRLDKIEFLINFILQYQDQKAILFVNTCAGVDFYTKLFQNMPILNKINITSIHGNMKQKKRNKVIENFRKQKTGGIVFATDVLARGIDIDDIQQIIQIDPPQDPSQFVHRIGRTARTGKQGKALILLDNNENEFLYYLKVKKVQIQEFDKSSIHIKYDQVHLKKIIEEQLKQDRDLIEKSKTAFISFIRSYKEHDLKYVFKFKDLDIGNVANSFYLFKLPRIKEILGRTIKSFTQQNIDIDAIPFKDKNQEKQFLELKEKRNEDKQKKEEEIKKKNELIKKQKAFGNKDVKNLGHIRRKQKRDRDWEDQEDFQEENNLVKKLKAGKITLEQYQEKMKEFDPEELSDIKYTKKMVIQTHGSSKKGKK